jgi:hypothetical protein
VRRKGSVFIAVEFAEPPLFSPMDIGIVQFVEGTNYPRLVCTYRLSDDDFRTAPEAPLGRALDFDGGDHFAHILRHHGRRPYWSAAE